MGDGCAVAAHALFEATERSLVPVVLLDVLERLGPGVALVLAESDGADVHLPSVSSKSARMSLSIDKAMVAQHAAHRVVVDAQLIGDVLSPLAPEDPVLDPPEHRRRPSPLPFSHHFLSLSIVTFMRPLCGRRERRSET
jgi:hypothetical protein